MVGAELFEYAHSVQFEALTHPLGDLALYVHWPFCLAKCPYCDFNSHVRDRIDQDRFGSALRRELATEAGRLGRRRLTSVFFGGGTPSLMDPSTVGALLDDTASWFDVADDLEITLEANPTSIEAGRLADYRAAGVNRVSIGIQSLDDTALRSLGRQHSAAAHAQMVRVPVKSGMTIVCQALGSLTEHRRWINPFDRETRRQRIERGNR